MDPNMEHHYKELLQQWKNDEDNIKDELKEIGIDVKEIGTDVKDLTKKLDDLVASTGSPAGQSRDTDGEYIQSVNGKFVTEFMMI